MIELLQASDSDRSAYLLDVLEFQRTEAAVGRDVIVIVTSRIVVADRVVIPPGTTVVKLDSFAEEDIADWLARWNDTNSSAISSGTFRALTPEVALRYEDLARQPLLLLMLALYTADPAVPALDAGLSMAGLYEQLLREFALREARKSLGLDARSDDVDEQVADHLDRLAIAALGMFNRGRQDVGEDEVGADLRALREDLMTRTRENEAGQRVVGEFFFVHTAEARPFGSRPGRQGRPTRRRYEFLHATFGEYLVASYIVSKLIDLTNRTPRGRRGPVNPDDSVLFALISHQPLAVRRSTLEFARDICATRTDDDGRRQMLDVLGVLAASYRYRPGLDKYSGYRPSPPDMVRGLACYSANLVSLRVAMEPTEDGVALTDLLSAPGDALAQWRSTVLLWQAGLDPDGLGSVLSGLALDVSDPPRVRDAAPTVAILSGNFARINDIFLARLLGDQAMEARIRYGAAVVEEFHYRDDLNHAAEPSRWIHEFATTMIPVLAGLRPPYLLQGPPGGISHHDAQVAAGLILRYLDSASSDLELAVPLVQILLFELPQVFEMNPTALARAVLRDPQLLHVIPVLRNPDIYGSAYPALLFLASDDLLTALGDGAGRGPPRVGPVPKSLVFFCRPQREHGSSASSRQY